VHGRRRAAPWQADLHVEYDEATALLVGDALQSLAFQLLAERPLTMTPRAQLHMLKLLAQLRFARHGGRAGDRSGQRGKQLSVPELEFMHIHKTGALIRAAVCSARIVVR